MEAVSSNSSCQDGYEHAWDARRHEYADGKAYAKTVMFERPILIERTSRQGFALHKK